MHPSIRRGTRSFATEEEVAAFDESFNFTITDAALEHPETTIRMHPADAAGTEDGFSAFDAAGNLFGCLDTIYLDVNYTDANADVGAISLRELRSSTGRWASSSTR